MAKYVAKASSHGSIEMILGHLEEEGRGVVRPWSPTLRLRWRMDGVSKKGHHRQKGGKVHILSICDDQWGGFCQMACEGRLLEVRVEGCNLGWIREVSRRGEGNQYQKKQWDQKECEVWEGIPSWRTLKRRSYNVVDGSCVGHHLLMVEEDWTWGFQGYLGRASWSMLQWLAPLSWVSWQFICLFTMEALAMLKLDGPLPDCGAGSFCYLFYSSREIRLLVCWRWRSPSVRQITSVDST